MKETNLNERLKQAFPPLSPEAQAAVEAAFRRGQRAVRMRRLLTACAASAAALLVLWGAVRFLPVAGIRPIRPDFVAAQPEGRRGGGGASLPSPTLPPTMPDPTPSPAPTLTATDTAPSPEAEDPSPVAAEESVPEATESPRVDDRVVYSTPGGIYFHRKDTCKSMQGGEPHSVVEALAAGKRHCPVCLGDEAAQADTYLLPVPATAGDAVYFGDNNAYYHRDPECFRMSPPQLTTLDQAAVELGLRPCPACLLSALSSDAEPKDFFMTENGQFFHTDPKCSNMTGAFPVSETVAEARGKFRCPVCAETQPEGFELFVDCFSQPPEVNLFQGWYNRAVTTPGAEGTDDKQSTVWYLTDGMTEVAAVWVEKTSSAAPDANALSRFEVRFPDAEAAEAFMAYCDDQLVSLYFESAPMLCARLLARPKGQLFASEKNAAISDSVPEDSSTVLDWIAATVDEEGQLCSVEMRFFASRPILLSWRIEDEKPVLTRMGFAD